jgi:hypothetical protein
MGSFRRKPPIGCLAPQARLGIVATFAHYHLADSRRAKLYGREEEK